MDFYSLTDVGMTREINQDYFFCGEDPVGNLPNLFLVADGMGGHKAGEFASRNAVEAICDIVQHDEGLDCVSVLENAIKQANKLLIKYSNEHIEMRGMGTTIVAAVIDDNNHLTVANVGDSRLYVINDNNIEQISEDHSLVAEMVRMGEMDKERARNHPDKNIITRALGADEEVQVDFFHYDLSEGEKILMCSDGLSNMIADDELKSIINEDLTLDEIAEKLVATANKNGGADNITLILIKA